MRTPNILLASQSPRRRELLALLAIPFTAVRVDTPEQFECAASLEENVRRIAEEKAREARRLYPEESSSSIILSADTVVEHDGLILQKPQGEEEALAMLQSLQGRTHSVHTGYALLYGERKHTAMATTRVTFNAMPKREIMRYIATGSPFDKAGAYGIQDPVMASYVSGIEGCYYNVVGLPLSAVWAAIQKMVV
ncbi:Maf family protein [Pelodictyon luteolum]|uniref:dTTP/UTP pyrophosphatase n=1 Tax=Chlorobium luteolum (strain DSM 273 / BCRC 81028 / 2530) TaxID=319225 RepID=NTPPA_CHLL3|nr:Maf family protein [Pelodictyon luteolum]Q3B3P0.1 RecName: Full=dTTP/UTP pyrophosphatase; Short=dTTPase/UTPase; AltName: Full=Nucleoside triphosphate pyrophosphatase; AltName: Full=Nucleotide pyrophosphatase; Short=Nucleotide PPase [Pelodictyon luteolum DSM 273]ABB24041.1 Maf-like protein [Pelodictyon luteolum DSM 273]